MEWFEDLVSRLLSSLPASATADPILDRLAALAAIAGSKRFRRKELKDVKRVFHAELSQFVASGKRPRLAMKRTDEIRRHHVQIRDLSLLVMLPLDRDSRELVSTAILDENSALAEAYYAYVDRIH